MIFSRRGTKRISQSSEATEVEAKPVLKRPARRLLGLLSPMRTTRL